MKIKISYFLIITSIAVFSCRTAKNGSSNLHHADNSKSSPDWTGIYSGVLPCADCRGIQTTITLNKDNTYELETIYLDKSTDITKSGGTFSWNQAGTVITLDKVKNNIIPAYYALGENKLTQLDLKGNYITGKLSDQYVLTKQNSGITEKYWKLIEINGIRVIQSETWKKEPHMILKIAENKLTGNAGCNSFFGTYRLSERNHVSFSNFGSTEMACPDMEIEKQFLKIFGTADTYSIQNDTLSIKGSDDVIIAKFKAVYLK